MTAPAAPRALHSQAARVPALPKQLFSEWLQCGRCHTLIALCVIIDGQRVEQAERERDEARAQAAALCMALGETHQLWILANPLIIRGDDQCLVPFMELHQPIKEIEAALRADTAAALILAVIAAARCLNDCAAEFERDASMACGEDFQALRDALAKLDGKA